MKKINWPDQIFSFLGIIIGVSLAFFINNASERNQEKNELKQIINSFISELDQEIDAFENYSIPKNKAKISFPGYITNVYTKRSIREFG